MAQRPIREYEAKRMLAEHWRRYVGELFDFPGRLAGVTPETDLEELAAENDWIGKEKLVVKPDMIVGKRGKHGLILLDKSWKDAKRWLEEKRGGEAAVGEVTGRLTHFLIEPFVKAEKEYYLAIKSGRFGDNIYFSTAGGIDIEENWENVVTIRVPVLEGIESVDIEGELPAALEPELRKKIAPLIRGLFMYYLDLDYAFIEINPFVVKENALIPLDVKCRLDDTAVFEAGSGWGEVTFPAPFGRKLSDEERYVKELDEKSGASLKLTILNPKGKIWTMVAGGGASVIYTDTIADLGYAETLANYGEYSGNPSTDETYEYAKTILDLMTRGKNLDGSPKYLIIGGGIANFTDVAKTFTGIIKALTEFKEKLSETPARIFVRRGGPNYQEGLKKMREVGATMGVPIEVCGPETHMTEIVSMAIAESEEAVG